MERFVQANSGREGFFQLSLPEMQALAERRRMKISWSRCQLAVVDSHAADPVAVIEVDLEQERLVVLQLPLRAGALVRAAHYGNSIYPQVEPGKIETFSPGSRPIGGVRLPNGWWRFEPLELGREWTVTFWHGEVEPEVGQPSGGSNTALPRHYFSGPVRAGEFVHVEVPAQAGPALAGRLVDEQGEPFALRAGENNSLLVAVSSSKQPRRDFFCWSTLLADGRFIARPIDGQWREDQSMSDFDRVDLIWNPRASSVNLGPGEPERDARLELRRGSGRSFRLAQGENFVELGDVVLASEGALFEVRVTGPDGLPVHGASVKVELVFETARGERTRSLPGDAAVFTELDGVAKFFLPSWEWAAAFGSSDSLRSGFGAPQHGRLTANAPDSPTVSMEFDLAMDSIEVQLIHAGTLAGSIQLPDSGLISGVSVMATDPGVPFSRSNTIAYARLRNEDDQLPSFRLPSLRPGPVDVVISLANSNWELARIADVLVEPGIDREPAELQAIDLASQLRIVDLELRENEQLLQGRHSAFLKCRGSQDRLWQLGLSVSERSTVPVPLPSDCESWTGSLRIDGYRTVPLQDVPPGSFRVNLERLQTLELRVPALAAKDADDWSVALRLGEGSEYQSSDLRPNAGIGRYFVPGPGSYVLQWWDRSGLELVQLDGGTIELTQAQLEQGWIELVPPAALLD